MPSKKVPRVWAWRRPCASTVWLTSSFIITSWLIGSRATRSSSRSKRSSSRSGATASVASPHSAASAPVRESPVSSSRLARIAPIRSAHIAVVGEPQTRAGG